MASIYTIAFATLIQIILTECNANFDARHNSLEHALRNILSPINTEKAIQIIQMAANGQIGKPISCIDEKLLPIATAPIRRIPPTGLAPIGVAPIGTPPITAIQRSIQPNGHPYLFTRGPSDIPIDLHNLVELLSANVIQKQNSVPKFEMPNIPIVINTQREILQVPSAKEVSCPCASQTPVGNPFLPAASPISAWAPPMSNLLPTALPTQSRGHFLRKIPIPPPTL